MSKTILIIIGIACTVVTAAGIMWYHNSIYGICWQLDVWRLREINAKASTPELIKLLQDNSSPVRYSAAYALGRFGHKESIPEIIKLLQHENTTIRESAVMALEFLFAQESIPAITKLLQDDDYYVRWQAATTLGKLTAKEAIPELKKLLTDKAYFVRDAAAEALKNIGVPESEIKITEERKYVTETLIGRLGYPLGTDLIIEGTVKGKIEHGKGCIVDTLNGNKLKSSIDIEFRYDDYPYAKTYLVEGKRCIISGWECGEMSGIPDEVAKAEKFARPQPTWHFHKYFIISYFPEPGDDRGIQKNVSFSPQQETIIPMGSWGYPLGTYLTIEGRIDGGGPIKGGGYYLIADTVNGQKLEHPSFYAIVNINTRYFYHKERFIIRGYESVEVFSPFYKYFIATSVVQPTTLKLENEPQRVMESK